MDNSDHQAEKSRKQDFLIERIAFFSDAVFAIAITLLILDIHPPLIKSTDTEATVWLALKKIMPELLGLLVSFWLIGLTWLRHHQLFKYVDTYDIPFMLMNLCLLFTIILFPFSTSFLFNSIFEGGVSKLQVFFYLGVPLASGIILYRMYKMVNKKTAKGITDTAFHRALAMQLNIILSFLLALVWILIMPFSYHPVGYIFLAFPSILSLINKKKYKNK